MSMVVWGGSAPKGESAWGGSDDSGAGVYLQACNAPLTALVPSTADGTQGAMQYKALAVFNWAGFMEPGDREQFYYCKQTLMFCADTTVVSGICKVRGGLGRLSNCSHASRAQRRRRLLSYPHPYT